MISARCIRTGVAAAWLCASGSVFLAFGEQVSVSVPGSVYFQVVNVSTSTAASPYPVTVSFQSASLTSGRSLRISVKAVAAGFSLVQGSAIPGDRVTWTTSGASGGTGFSGALSNLTFATVYQSTANPTTGSVSLSFILQSPGSNLKAGSRMLALEWRFESVP